MSEKKYRKWFEMEELKKRDFNDKSWIPLCSYHTMNEIGKYGYIGWEEEYFGAIGILFPIDIKDKAIKCDWAETNPSHDNRPWASENDYIEAGYFDGYENDVNGEYLVLQQYFDTGDTKEWHLSQDLVLSLGLKREGDKWLCPGEDYIEVARLQRNSDGSPILLEIRNEHLKDYLSARKSGALISIYQSRRAIQQTFEDIDWKNNHAVEHYEWGMWDGLLSDIVEGGEVYGSKVAVFHMERTDVDFDDDVPKLEGGPKDENIKSKSWEFERKGKKLAYGSGEIWMRNWIDPASTSPRIKGDKVASKIEFIIDTDGKQSTLDTLEEESRWLWFKPDVVNEILKRPNGFITWYTKDTGKLGTSNLHTVHFGMNEIGLINVNIGDLVRMPESQLKIWASFNVTPDGKASKELLMSQVSANPAKTFSPERDLFELLNYLNNNFKEKYNLELLKEHSLLNEYWNKINRFKSIDKDGLLLLCKELRRFIIERIDENVLKKIRPNDPKEIGSIKRIERLLDDFGFNGREITAPLVGINELRQADAHLPSENLENSYKLAEIDFNKPYPIIGKDLISTLANRIFIIADIIKKNT